ncbi:hypothetical protein WR25_06596 [Diploscapter pachys]|uniref:Mediator of RNA polymerase II transcription subunit 19 n=1 Tax=Diploscapter pachys TaxID=2018661 RepID=A0A2A2KT01_9BILA|nr:hypothetical protein WR25_06596 [Diploscapter pachys]
MGDSPLNAGASSSGQTTGSLRTKISLKAGAATPSYTVVSPFYCMKQEVPPKSNVLGSTDLLGAYDLSSVYSRFCSTKKMREDLASFLPHIYGNFDFAQGQDTSSLRTLYEKPPITGKEISNVSPNHMNAFRLNVGTATSSTSGPRAKTD